MLKKLFIKDYQNTENLKVKRKYGIVAGIFGILINLFLGTLKLLLGLFSNSVTIMADAFNNVTDMTSSILTIINFKLSGKKSNKYKPYSYIKYEYYSSIIISLLMLILGITFFIKSIIKIIIPEELIINYITYIILFISLFAKLIQYNVLLDFSNSIKSKTLRTTALETRNDIITTISILISMIIMKIFNINIDGYIGLLVSSFIIYTSFNNLFVEIKELTINNNNNNKINEIKSKLLSYEYIEDINNIIIHTYGKKANYLTINAKINNNLDLNKIYYLLNNIEKQFNKEFNINLIIHIEINNPT